jgi:UrcA family protein
MRIVLKVVALAALLLPLAAAAEARPDSGRGTVLIFVPDAEYKLHDGESRADFRRRVKAEARAICAPGPSSLDEQSSRICEAALLRRAEASLADARPLQTAAR